MVCESESAFQVLTQNETWQAFYERVVQRLRRPKRLLGLAPLKLLPSLDRERQVGGRGRAVLRLLRQCPHADELKCRRHLGPQTPGRCRFLLAHLAKHFPCAVTGERWDPGQDLVENRTEPVDVGAMVDQVEPADSLLRRHVRWRAQRLARHGVATVDAGLVETRPPLLASPSGWPTSLASPQSSTTTSPKSPMITFWPLRSR